ncbi:MAG: hypothetical protein R3F51_26100 [Cyanobacteriota/Melainabacteria group bacterium]
MDDSKNLESLSKRKALLDREIMAYHQAGVQVPADLEKAYSELENQEKEIPQEGSASLGTAPVLWSGWLGKKVSGYLINHLLHEGTYSCVFEAEDGGKKLAVKIASHPDSYPGGYIDLARAEKDSDAVKGKTLALSPEGSILTPEYNSVVEEQANRLKKAGRPFVPILDSGKLDGAAYYLMPLFTGKTMRQLMNEGSLTDVVKAFRRILDAIKKFGVDANRLSYFSNLKPEHIIFEGDSPVFLDAGSSGWLTTESGRLSGILTTPRYNPGLDNAPWSALCIMLYELATGTHLLEASTGGTSRPSFASKLPVALVGELESLASLSTNPESKPDIASLEHLLSEIEKLI